MSGNKKRKDFDRNNFKGTILSKKCSKSERNLSIKLNKHHKYKKLFSYFFLYVLIFCSVFKCKGSMLNSKYSYIELIIEGGGENNILYEKGQPSCPNVTLPNEIYINGINQTNIDYKYNFTESENRVKLVWYNNLGNLACMFHKCSKIKKIDFSNFNSSSVYNINSAFNGCNSLTSIDFTGFEISKISRMHMVFLNCYQLSNIDLSNFGTSKVTEMTHTFSGCQSLKSIDLSNFDTSKVVNMFYMFNDCQSLNNINLSNFVTSNVKNMTSMFKNCKNLSYIDLSNFDTSNVIDISSMFESCEKLTSIDLSSFITSNVIFMNSTFIKCFSLKSINISNFNTSNVIYMHGMFNGCNLLKSIDLSNFRTENLRHMGSMFKNCKNLESIDLSCFNPTEIKTMDNVFYHCEKLTSINLSNINTWSTTWMQSMFEGCINLEYINLKNVIENEKLNFTNIFNDVPEDIVVCLNVTNAPNLTKLIKEKICHKIDCSYDWLSKKKKIINEREKCTYSCNGSKEYTYADENYCYKSCLCESCINDFYPKENDLINTDKYIKCYKNPEGYYFDNESDHGIYRSCYFSCKECEFKGNDSIHNCRACKDNYSYELIHNDNAKNCYNICPFYYYFDTNVKQYYCTKNYICPKEYSKLILDKNECIKNCNESIYNKYEFQNKCYKECPPKSILSKDRDYFCEAICDEENPFLMIKTQKCVDFCDILSGECKLNYVFNKKDENNTFILDEKTKKKEEIKLQNKLLKNIEQSFISSNFNTSDLENGKESIIQNNKMTITLTTTENQKNTNNNNMTRINLGECENELRRAYKIPNDTKLFMRKIDIIQEEINITKVEYDVYCRLNGTNLEKLNLSFCDKTKIEISVPIKITGNVDKLNTSSNYFNDICYISTSDSGTDISLSDRKIEYIEGNKVICQDDCDFSYYNDSNQNAKCSCKVKESSKSVEYMYINKSKLYDKFVDVDNIQEEDIITAIENQKSPTNFGITACDVLSSKENIKSNTGFYLLLFILAIFIIIYIIFCTKGYNLLENKIDDVIYKKFENKKKKVNKIKTKKLMKPKNPIKKKNSKSIINANKPLVINNTFKIMPQNSKALRKRKKSQKGKIINLVSLAKQNTKNKEEQKETSQYLKPDTDYELNWLTYEDALKYDKRDCCSYYCSLIRSKQLFIFTFCSFNDYNSGIIKKFMFFLSFALHYSVNALFFTDSTMHQIYLDEGKFNFNYQIPKIIYSALISTFILRLMLHTLILTDKDILAVKLQKTKEEAINMKKKKLKCIIIKYTIFFILNFILLVLFWYYLTCFNAIYKNTQIYLIENTFISFGLSLFYPFIINIFPSMIRICSIKSSNKNQNYGYKLSQIIQLI